MSFALSYAMRCPTGLLRTKISRLQRLTSTSTQSASLSYSAGPPVAVANGMHGLPYVLGGVAIAATVFGIFKGTSRSSSDAKTNVEAQQRSVLMLDGAEKVSSPRERLKNFPLTKDMMSQDNLFDKMMEVDMVKEIHCYYDSHQTEFHSVIHLGKEVCGYPNTVHGGLTAAIIDETFGGLMFNVWTSGKLGFSLPAVTSRLEVDYCKRLPQNSIVICTTRLDGDIEGRSLWMEAELTDGSRTITYATAKACFKTPKWSKSAMGWAKGLLGF